MRRLNTDGRGILLGEFKGDDKIVVWTSKNQYYITDFNVGQHFPDETVRIDRYVAGRVYSVCYFDGEQGYYYMKRFQLEASEKMQSFLDEGTVRFVAMTDRGGATLVMTYQGAQASRPADEIDVDSFVGVKSHRAKGKRLSTYDIASLTFVEPELPSAPDAAGDSDGGPASGDDAASGGAHAPADGGAHDAATPSNEAGEDSGLTIDPEQLNLF